MECYDGDAGAAFAIFTETLRFDEVVSIQVGWDRFSERARSFAVDDRSVLNPAHVELIYIFVNRSVN